MSQRGVTLTCLTPLCALCRVLRGHSRDGLGSSKGLYPIPSCCALSAAASLVPWLPRRRPPARLLHLTPGLGLLRGLWVKGFPVFWSAAPRSAITLVRRLRAAVVASTAHKVGAEVAAVLGSAHDWGTRRTPQAASVAVAAARAQEGAGAAVGAVHALVLVWMAVQPRVSGPGAAVARHWGRWRCGREACDTWDTSATC